MRIGGEYRLHNIGLRQWRKLATDVRIDEELLIARVGVMAARVPDLVATIRKDIEAEGLHHSILRTPRCG